MNAPRFFQLISDATDRVPPWFLGSPAYDDGEAIDPRTFIEGVRFMPRTRIAMPIDYGGVVVDFNFAPFDMLVVRASLGEAIEALAGAAVQRLPVTLAGQPNVFEILNICQRVPCVDEERSSYVRWTDADGRPDKVGQFRYFKRLRVDSALAQGHHLFRIAEWSIVPIASRQMKDVIERAGATGVAFEPV